MSSSQAKVVGSLNVAQQKKSSGSPATDTRKKVEKFKLDLFKAGALGYLRTVGVLESGEGDTEHPSVSESIELWEIARAKRATDWPNAPLALADYRSWLDEAQYTYVAPVLYTVTGLTVTLSMTVLSGTFSVSANVIVNAPMDEVIIGVRNELQDALRKAFPPKTQATIAPKQTEKKATKEQALEEVNITGLRVQEYNGKIRYFGMPANGKWVTYGIPIYPDKTPLPFDEIPTDEGEYEVDWKIKYSTKPDGKPLRAEDIEVLSETEDSDYAF